MRRLPTPSRGRRSLFVAAVALFALAIAFTALSGFFVDVLWFREVRFSQVFWKVLWTKALLGVVFGAVFFAILYANLVIVRASTPRYRPMTPEQEILERYRLAFEPYAWWLLPLVAAVIAAFVGYGVTTRWETFLLWRSSAGVTFGPEAADPQFGRDPAFYIFTLPWFRFVQGWLFSSLVGITLITAAAHYLWGGIRPQAPGFGEKVTPQVKAHLSVLLGLIVLTKAWGYYLGQFDLVVSPRGIVAGASYTDVNAHLPALRILAFIAVVCAILFLVNIRMRGWALPVIAVGLLVLVSITAGAAYPAFIQRFRVAPQELQLERDYIERNITATRRAFGLDAVDEVRLPSVAPAIDGEAVEDNSSTIANIRVWRPSILQENFESLQRIRSYYEVNDVDVDRYEIDGERRMLMISAREVTQNGIPGGGGTWQNRHLVYTHGYGAIAAQVNTATTEGAPVFLLRDIPPTGTLADVIEQPRVYFGEGHDTPYILVGTDAEELDYQSTGDEELVAFEYDGDGGIPIGGLVRRALFAWRFRDVNLLISGLIDGDSRIMMYQELVDRVPRAAPFLRFDGDPYVAIVDGRVVWIWDAYTVSDQYPYSQPVDLSQVTTPSSRDQVPPLAGQANYIRNSVKVVVDAYDGSMTFYAVDEEDPILEVWRTAFPDLFSPRSEASADLEAHFRYPENLFQVQAAHFVNYHVEEPNVFYQKQDFWQVPADPTLSSETTTVPMRPYYTLMRLPGDQDESFVLIMPFTPEGRLNMIGWMAAEWGPEQVGRLLSFEFPGGVSVDGPSQAFARINQDPRFASERTLLGQTGSAVLFGDLLVIPMDDAFLYVLPMYVRSEQQAIPELTRVVVVNGGVVGIGETIQEAIADSLGEPPPDGDEPPDGEPPTGGGNVREQVAALIQEALEHFEAAQDALREGDLATYQEEIEAAEAAIDRASRLAGASGRAGPTAEPSPPVTPSPSPSP